MALAGLTAAGITSPRLAELTASSLWLSALGVGLVLVAVAVTMALGSPQRCHDPLLRVTAALAGALLIVPAGLA